MAEVLKGLTPRLADSQSNLKPLAASAIAELASSVGTDVATKVLTTVGEVLRKPEELSDCQLRNHYHTYLTPRIGTQK